MWIRVWMNNFFFIYEFIHEFIYKNINSYMNPWIWIHTQTLLAPPNSHVFFMNSCVNSWFFMIIYEFTVWIHMQTLLGTHSWFFMILCRISSILAFFHERDHIQIHVWRISWKISWKMLRHNDIGVFRFCIQNSWNQVCLLKSCISIKSSVRTDNSPSTGEFCF